MLKKVQSTYESKLGLFSGENEVTKSCLWWLISIYVLRLTNNYEGLKTMKIYITKTTVWNLCETDAFL